MLTNIRLSVRQFLEAMGDENRFYTSRALDKSFGDCTVMDLVAHYVANTPPSMTVVGFDVSRPDHLEPTGFVGNPSENL